MKYFDMKTVRKIMDFTEEEIREALGSKWRISDNWIMYFKDDKAARDFGVDILARAITYAIRKYPGRDREIGIFATLVEGFTTGMFGGFGQDQDPLYEKAEEAVITLAGGIPPSIADPDDQKFFLAPDKPTRGLLSKEEFTRAAIQLLENVCFAENLEDTITTALAYIERAIEKMEKTRKAFKSKTIADARRDVEQVKEILGRVISR